MATLTASASASTPVRRRTVSRQCKVNYFLDAAILVAFVVDMNVGFTGLAIHEWLGLGVALGLFVHVVLHADWVERITVRLVSNAPTRERIRWFVDLALFASVVSLIATGVLISEFAVASLGSHDRFWVWLHVESAKWSIYLIGAHLGLSWRWIKTVTRGLIGRRTTRGCS